MANIQHWLDQIRRAIYGREVRSSIADSIEAINKEQSYLDGAFDQLIINAGNSNAEVVAARVKEDGTPFNTLGERLNKNDDDLLNLKNSFDEVNKEVIEARTDKDGVDHGRLKDRLNNIDEQLEHIENKISVNINDFKMNGENDTVALKNAMIFLSDRGGVCKLNKGKIIITETITIPNNVTLEGEGYSVSLSDITGTEIVKQFNGDGIVLNGLTSKLTNLTVNSVGTFDGDGVVLKGGRATVTYVSIFNQGRDGLRIGDDIATRCNLWSCDHVISLKNKRYGVYINSVGSANGLPDCNGGVFNGLDSRGNTKGLVVGNANDNIFIGIACQSNTEKGIEISGKANMFNLPYTEANNVEIDLTSSSQHNYILGYRTGLADGVVDSGINNFVLGRGQQTKLNRFKTPLLFDSLNFGVDEYKKGYWGFEHETTGNSKMMFKGSGTTPVRHTIGHDNNGSVVLRIDGLEIGESSSQYIKFIKHLEKGISIPQLQPKATVNIPINLTGVVKRNTVICSPESLTDGLLYNCFISDVDTLTLKISNITDSVITASNVVFSFDVICR